MQYTHTATPVSSMVLSLSRPPIDIDRMTDQFLNILHSYRENPHLLLAGDYSALVDLLEQYVFVCFFTFYQTSSMF